MKHSHVMSSKIVPSRSEYTVIGRREPKKKDVKSVIQKRQPLAASPSYLLSIPPLPKSPFCASPLLPSKSKPTRLASCNKNLASNTQPTTSSQVTTPTKRRYVKKPKLANVSCN